MQVYVVKVMLQQHLVPVSSSLFDDGLHVCDVGEEQRHVQHALGHCLLCGVQIHVQIWGRTPLKMRYECSNRLIICFADICQNYPI